MKIKRRNFFSLMADLVITSFGLTRLNPAPKKYLNTVRKRSLPFTFGWYEYIENTSAPVQLSSKGIDMLMPYLETTLFGKKSPIIESPQEKFKLFLDTAKEAKVKVLMEIPHALVESGNITGIKEFVRAYKNHSAVYGWHLYDEPELRKPDPISPTLLTNIYQVIKKEEKSKPVAIVFNDVNKAVFYINAMDIIMWDTYPCNEGDTEFQWAAYYRSVLNQIAATAKTGNKKFLNVLQAYAGHGLIKRLPTKAEFYYMFYCSIFSGADGLLFWMHPWSTPCWNESVLYPTIKEFKSYLPAIVKGVESNNLAPVNSADRVEIKSFSIPNSKKAVAIAINHTETPINLKVKVDRKLAGQIIICNNKDIDRISNQSDFKVSLDPYAVRIYKIG